MQSPEGAIPSRGGETVDGCGCRTQENESIRATPPTTPCLLSGDTSENIGLSGISAHGFSCVFIIATSRSGYSREPSPPRPDAMMRAMRTSPNASHPARVMDGVPPPNPNEPSYPPRHRPPETGFRAGYAACSMDAKPMTPPCEAKRGGGDGKGTRTPPFPACFQVTRLKSRASP